MTAEHVALGELLAEKVTQAGVVDAELLSSDPVAALAADTSVRLVWVDPSTLPRLCGIAAAYDPASTPATIAVAHGDSPGRVNFSALHEYGHHLRDQVDDVVLKLLQARSRRATLEERMCDSFAAAALVPSSLRRRILSDGVTATSVRDLLNSTSASRQATMVAAAEDMTTPGYVMTLNQESAVEFAARSGDVYPVRNGARQEGVLLRAAALGTPTRTTTTVAYGTGAHTGELHVDAVMAGQVMVVVAVDGAAPWRSFSGGRSTWAEPVRMWCAECSTSSDTFAAPCANCEEHRCPNCGRCGCVNASVRGERTCTSCFLTLPPTSFSGSATVCEECT